ncbi:MAG: HlyD family efflux transporter periplasmic adaptor subunit [Planctomycetaceae bacterium]|nr:HlyD family efflux transporter periplasmic adaptor subunit [Planctomycetaceae bacterium]
MTIRLNSIVLSGLLGVSLFSPHTQAEDSLARSAVVLLKTFEAVDVPAQEAGVLVELAVTEGAPVEAGAGIGRIQDSAARLEWEQATLKLQLAQHRVEETVRALLATKAVEQEEQRLKELESKRRVVDKLATNDVAMRLAGKVRQVAQNQLDRAESARARFPNSVSDAEVDGLKLSIEKATLEAEQAEFDQAIEALKVAVEDEALAAQRLAIDRARLEIDQVQSDRERERLEVLLAEQNVQLAKLAVERRQITSPVDGIVVERYRQQGEWVQPGENVVRVIRMDRLRVEGFLPLEQLSEFNINTEVRLTVQAGRDVLERPARIVFINPEIDPVNREARVWAEVDNSDRKLRPGMRGTLTLMPPVK